MLAGTNDILVDIYLVKRVSQALIKLEALVRLSEDESNTGIIINDPDVDCVLYDIGGIEFRVQREIDLKVLIIITALFGLDQEQALIYFNEF